MLTGLSRPNPRRSFLPSASCQSAAPPLAPSVCFTLHLKITLPFDTNDCPWDVSVKALSSYLHLFPEPNQSGDWVPPCEPRLRAITMLQQSQAKLIMWVQWYFYWNTFSRHRRSVWVILLVQPFSPSINDLLQKDAWLLQAQVRVTLRVQLRQWRRSRCTAGWGKALLR